jgi:hypothetical protein
VFAEGEVEERLGLTRGRMLVIAQGVLSLQHAKFSSLGERHPEPGFAAEATVAAGRACREVELRFELNRATVTAASIRLFHTE